MPIVDYWLNPLVSGTRPVLGYREAAEAFPHDIYSFFLSSIRDQDIRNGNRLLWRWVQGMQLEWESIYGRILTLPDLQDPDNCPIEWLQYLAWKVGVTSELGEMWGVLNDADKRRLTKFFVRFLREKSTHGGYVDLLQTMFGFQFDLQGFFDYRWILSGDEDREVEGALGREDDGYDPHLLSEDDVPVGVEADNILLWMPPVVSDYYYEFQVQSLYALYGELDPPRRIRVTYRPTGQSVVLYTQESGSVIYGQTDPGEVFGQTAAPYSTNKNDFRVAFEPDPFVFDIRAVDFHTGLIDRDKVVELVKFYRHLSERIYVRYYWLIEDFSDEDFENWAGTTGTYVHDADAETVTLSDVGANSGVETAGLLDSGEWQEYSVAIRAMNNTVSKYIELRFYRQDADNYMYVRFTPNPPPTIPPGTYRFGYVNATVDSVLATGNLDEQFDLGVNYFWRVIIEDVGGGDFHVQIYQDEDRITELTITSPWATSKGNIEVVSETGGEVVLSRALVHSFPMVSDYIGL
jgi:hypothetical protein